MCFLGCSSIRLSAVLVLLAVTVSSTNAQYAVDWADLTNGLAGSTITFPSSQGITGRVVLLGSTFPVMLSSDGAYTAMAASRVAAGRAVVFTKESFTTAACGASLAACNSNAGRLAINSLRWAAGKPVPSPTVTVRLAASSGVSDFNSAFFSNLASAGASVGVTFTPPTGRSSNIVPDLALCSTAACTDRIADVLLTTALVAFSAAQLANITAFIQAGGGIVTGGQAWNAANLQTYPGNMLLAPLNVVQWTGDSTEWYPVSWNMPAAPPDPVKFNVDAAAAAVLAHINGTAVLPAADLAAVAGTVGTAILQKLSLPAASAALWSDPASSQLAVAMRSQAQSWTCGAVPSADPLNKLAASYIVALQQQGPAASVTPAPCYASFPGLPKSGATTVTTTVTVNATSAGNYTVAMNTGTAWLSTGLWAPAGQPITATISSSLAASLAASGVGSLRIQIGSHSDDISRKTTWCRLPFGMTQQHYFSPAAGGNVITAASGVGGLIYLVINEKTNLGLIQVAFSGVMRAPLFVKGQTSEADWIATIRNHPAPFGEIASSKFIMTIPSSYLATVGNPKQIADMWDAALDAMADLSVITYDRPRAERFVLDCDISAGYMHSGYPIMGPVSASPDLLSTRYGDPTEIDSKWGPFHELGHNMVWGAWTLANTGETVNNIYTVYALEKVMGVPRTARSTLTSERVTSTAKYMASGVFSTDWTVWTALYTYLQLQENVAGPYNYTGGWDFYKRVLARYQVLSGTDAASTDDKKLQTWVLETSQISGKNLVPFYKAWKFPVSAATESTVNALNLAPFDFNPAGPCGQACDTCCLVDGAPPLPNGVAAAILPGNGCEMGSFQNVVLCPAGSFVTGLKTRVEPNQGSGDDTGLNAVSLQCKNPAGSITATEILSYAGLWGTWSALSSCPGSTFAVAVALRVLPDQGSGDDIAADAVALTCSDNTTVLGTPNALGLGAWGPTARCPAGTAICGYKIRFAPYGGDDTAMTDIVAYCCNLPVPQPPSPSPPPPPAVDCIGSWTAKTACNSTCSSPGIQIQTYVITTAAANGGAACPFANGTTNSTLCSAQICPVDCIGSWTPLSACSATACGTTGVQTQRFVVTTAAANGGAKCAFADGATNSTACSAAPCPVNCIGSWSSPTPCNATCGGGATTQTYTITAAAANGGSPCPFASGTTNSTACNTQACAAHVIVSTIKPSVGGAWGTWSSFAGCPVGSWAAAARMRVQPNQGKGDDTGLNSVEVTCKTPAGITTGTINPNLGLWGAWSAVSSCPAGRFINGVSMRVLAAQGSGDDVAADAVQLLCSDSVTVLNTPNAVGFGTWGAAVRCPASTAVCGFRVRFEPNQGGGDDTAFNDIELHCCAI